MEENKTEINNDLFIGTITLKSNSKNSGITLIALIVTIIVLLILVGVTIISLTGEQGLVGRANTAQIQNKTNAYIEEIKLEATNENIERAEKEKTEVFIISIKNRLEVKNWVKQITASDESLRTDVPDSDKNLLVVNTKEDYVIMVNVDNERLKLSINGTSDRYETYTITYVANNGTSETTTQNVIKGLSVNIKENTYTKQYNSFVGWCENQNGEGTRYVKGSTMQIDSNKTLYAIWRTDIVILSFDANGGTGTMETILVDANSEVAYPTNTMTRTGYNFIGWNTKADKSGNNYLDSKKEAIQIGEENITLYAQWEAITYDITYALDGGTTTNPSTYTADTDTFTLSSPVKEGYTFLGWTGTGISEMQTTYTITKGSTGNRNYIANWEKAPVYLYNEGTINSLAGDFTQAPNQGSYQTGTVTKNSNNIRMYRNVVWYGGDSASWDANACFTTNLIDLTEYTKIIYTFSKLTIWSTNSSTYPAGTTFSMCITTDRAGNYTAINNRKRYLDKTSPAVANGSSSIPGTYTLDISDYNGSAYVGMYDAGATWMGQGAEAVLTSIRLE